MDDQKLVWKINSKKKVFSTPVFDIYEQNETSYSNLNNNYIGIEAPEWVLVIAEYNNKFLMVKQFRHGNESLSIEFPGGVANKNEDPKETALRELEEETGYKAKNIELLATLSPNPAIFKNKVHFYYASELIDTKKQHLDEDENINVVTISYEELVNQYGDDLFKHAFTGTALFLYIRNKNKKY